MASRNISTLPRLVFSSELAALTYSATDSEQSVFQVVSRMADWGRVIFQATYRRDSSNRVTVIGLDSLLAAEAGSEPGIDVAFIIDGEPKGPAVVTVIPCAAIVPEGARSFCDRSFLSRADGVRDLPPGDPATLGLYAAIRETAEVISRYVVPGEGHFMLRNNLSEALGHAVLNVSPKVIDDINGNPEAELAEYAIVCGRRVARFRPRRDRPFRGPLLRFRNVFGRWEYARFAAASTVNHTFARSLITSAGEQTAYDIRETADTAASSGPLLPAEAGLLADLAGSREVFLVPGDGSAEIPVVITDSEVKRSLDPSAMPSFTITFRAAGGGTSVIRSGAVYSDPDAPRMFDNSFDATFN